MRSTKEEIEKIEKLIQKESQRRDKIENGNYILAMLLKEIKTGNLITVEAIAKWCFETIKTGDMVRQITAEDTKKKNIQITVNTLKELKETYKDIWTGNQLSQIDSICEKIVDKLL